MLDCGSFRESCYNRDSLKISMALHNKSLFFTHIKLSGVREVLHPVIQEFRLLSYCEANTFKCGF